MKLLSQASSLPLSYYPSIYSSNYVPPLATPMPQPMQTTTTSLPSELDFSKDLITTKLLHLFNHIYPKLIAPQKHIIHHLADSHKHKHSDPSYFSMMNPFGCQSDEDSEEEYDDDSD